MSKKLFFMTLIIGLLAFGDTVKPAAAQADAAPERLREVQRLGIPVLYKPVQAERLLATIGSLNAIEK